MRFFVAIGLGLVLVVSGCAGMMVARQSLIGKIDAEREILLKQGWSVSWRVSGFSLFAFPWQVTLRDVRLDGPLKDTRLVYGGDAVTVSPAAPFSSLVRLDFTGQQAFLLGHDSAHPDAAFRLTGSGLHATVGAANSGEEIHAAFMADDDQFEVYAMPFPLGQSALPFSVGLRKLQGRTEWYLKQNYLEGAAADVTVETVTLPVAWPGIGNLAEKVHVALSSSETEGGDRGLTLHIGEARFGPSTVAVTGKLVWQRDATGDFDLTLRGLEKVVDAMMVGHVVTPEVRHMTMLIERFRAQGNLQSPPKTEKTGEATAPDTIIALPLRLRKGEWTIGTLPAATLLEAWRSGKGKVASP
ncbi:DUF2125 domain-containing protein [Acetobacter sp. UBA5411]|uniref:DUF2125 domain-containing protein n=1 Tax=Acetobacter sp. UBA5411 TaxID=1945905 RepID=UPI0025C04FB3|nr:DUF2125 domain-containing protein [Acetobacter sp. UBA5411]